MKKFLLIFPLILSVAIGGGAIYLIALFGHFPLSYRLAMAISLLISYVNMRNTDWDEAMKQSQDLSGIMKRWLMELLESGAMARDGVKPPVRHEPDSNS